jgi:hypothetical protein
LVSGGNFTYRPVQIGPATAINRCSGAALQPLFIFGSLRAGGQKNWDIVMQIDGRGKATGRIPRDYRLDFFRGLSLFFIFIDHISDNPLRYFTLTSFALNDAAEVFIFISGYTAALVYGQKMLRDGPLFASALIWRRVWQLYVAHLCLFMLYSAEVAYTVVHFNNPLFSDELGIGDFLNRPYETLLRVLTLRFQPTFLDILPLYISLLFVFPLIMVAMRRHLLLALVPSLAIYLLVQATGINLPGNEDTNGWYFDPFAWQFLFVIGGCLGYAQVRGMALPTWVSWRWLIRIAGAITLVGLVLQVSWSLHELYPPVPGILMRELWPVDKTTLNPLRIVNILALAVLVAAFVPRSARFITGRLAWPIVLCGQNSLNVFCFSILLSLLGNIVLTFGSWTYLNVLAVNLVGVLSMIGLGLLNAWYGAGGTFPRRPVLSASQAQP